MKYLTALITILLSFVTAAHGDIIIEQSDITGEADYGTGQGQSFLLPAGATVAAIQLHIGSVDNGGGSVSLQLWEVTDDSDSNFTRIGNEPVATGTLDRSDVSEAPAWFTITLDTPYTNETGSAVYLVFEIELLTSGDDGWNNYSFSNLSSYSEGHLIYWTGSYYAISDGEDLTFRILDASPVPNEMKQEGTTGAGRIATGVGQSIILPSGLSITAIQLYIDQTHSSYGASDIALQLWETERENGDFIRSGESSVALGSLAKEEIGSTPVWVTVPLNTPYSNTTPDSIELVFDFIISSSDLDGVNYYSASDLDAYTYGSQVYWSKKNQHYEDESPLDLTFRVVTEVSSLNEASAPEVEISHTPASPSSLASIEVLIRDSVEGFDYTLYSTEDLSLPKEDWDIVSGSSQSGYGGVVNWGIADTEFSGSKFFYVKINQNE
jgi:hypothetical protein